VPRRTSRGAGLFHHQPHRAVRLALCLGASLALLGVSRWTRWRGDLLAVETAASAPVFRLWHDLGRDAADWRTAWRPHTRLVARVRRLERRLFLLRVRLAADRALALENLRLRRLLGLRRRLGRRAILAPVLRLPHDPYPPRMLLARGRDAGLRVGLPVVDRRGLVGVVVVVHARSALVRLLETRRTLVPVEDFRSQILTFVEGTGRLHRLALPFVPNGSNVRPGDLLVTSGLGGVYPSGYPVAVVTTVTPQPNYTFARIRARPLATPARDRDVAVLALPAPSSRAPAAKPLSPPRPKR
jgi:rod shape-determining protein MreC